MKKSKILTIALIACLVLLAAGSWMMFGKSAGISLANADQYTAGDAEITDPVENLDVEWTAGKVTVKYHEGEGIRISETCRQALAEDRKMQWWLDGTTLRIRYEKSGFRLFSFGDAEKHLTISLPEGAELKDVKIATTSGDQVIPDLKAESVSIRSTSGDVDAAVRTGELTGGSTSGSVKIRVAGDCGNVQMSTTSGGIALEIENAKEIRAESTSGGVALALSGKADNVKLGSTSGGIACTAAEVKKADISSTSGGIAVDFGAAEELKIHCTSGGIRAALPKEPGFTCKVSTTSGDFNTSMALEKNGNTYSCGDGSGKYEISATSGDVTIEEKK